MIVQNDHKKILSNFLLHHFFPGYLEKLENGKKRVFNLKKAPKIVFFKSTLFQATDLNDSSK